MNRELGRMLLLAGGILVVAGLVLTFGGRTGIGRLPGDFVYRRGTFTLYAPLMTSILLSVVLSLVFWFFRR